LDRDFLKQRIKDLKSKATVAGIVKEMLNGKHTVVYYRGDWAEDLRQAVYSKTLGDAFGLTSPY
jgi:hypothetical protein